MIEEKDYKFITEAVYKTKKESENFNCIIYAELYNEHYCLDHFKSIYIEIFDLLSKDLANSFIKDLIKVYYPSIKSEHLTILINKNKL